MTNYIIDPAWVYWANVLGVLKKVFAFVAVLSAITAIGALIAKLAINEIDDSCGHHLARKIFRVMFPIALLFIASAIFIPATETIIAMKVAELATRENVALSVDAIKSVVDYIVDAIKILK